MRWKLKVVDGGREEKGPDGAASARGGPARHARSVAGAGPAETRGGDGLGGQSGMARDGPEKTPRSIIAAEKGQNGITVQGPGRGALRRGLPHRLRVGAAAAEESQAMRRASVGQGPGRSEASQGVSGRPSLVSTRRAASRTSNLKK
jgi:hypothetical protein